jgi:hypothetical protein
MGAQPGSLQQVRQAQQQPVVEVAGTVAGLKSQVSTTGLQEVTGIMEVPSAVVTLRPLLSLIQRPAFKVRGGNCISVTYL